MKAILLDGSDANDNTAHRMVWRTLSNASLR
jgi:hypothetical protein